MAGLNGLFVTGRQHRRTDDRRGQVLFVTAIGLAVLLVVLSATLNATVDTGRVGPDGTATDASANAIRYQADARTAVGDAMAQTNLASEGSYDERAATLDERVQDWSALSARHAARDGTRGAVRLVGTTDGTMLAQTNASRTLTNADGNETWTLASDVDRVRAPVLRVTDDALVAIPTPSPSAAHLASTDVFTVTVAGGGESVRTFVYRNDSGAVVVSVDDGEGTLGEPCQVPIGSDGSYEVDLARATVGGIDCPQLATVAEVDGPYTVTFANGDNAAGTYSLVVDRRLAALDTDDFHDAADATSPTATRAIYDATVETTYANSDVNATLRLRVAPGEFDG